MAPIFVVETSWSQSLDNITINVPLKVTNKEEFDLFTYTNYIKVNAKPFIYEVFLFAEIDEEKCKCLFTDEGIIFELKKVVPEEWPQLAANIGKEEKILRRQEIVAKKSELLTAQKEAKRSKNYKLNQFAIQKQIGIGTSTRKEIEDLKQKEKDKVNEELKTLKEKGALLQLKNRPEERVEALSEQEMCYSPFNKEDFPIPLPRNPGKIQIKFTARAFPTPLRESKDEEEQEWLKKQLAARRATGFVAEDLRPEECDPVWLKEKGDSFFNHDNFLGAISAYSHAIKIGSKMPDLYCNRSAAHFRIGNLQKALIDCSTALEMLTPPVKSNEDMRFDCHVRRAAILCQLGVPEKSLSDYEAALKIQPKDEAVRFDYERAKRIADKDEESD